MSTTYPNHDTLRIPPKPRVVRAESAMPALPVQLAFSAVAAFGLAWLLSRLIIG